MKHLVIIDSNDILELKKQAKNKGYQIINNCEALYSHYIEVDEENKTFTMIDKKNDSEYETVSPGKKIPEIK